jgi:ABC-type polysaccharide/polyol phosphate transport system ATPase subunit
MRMAENIIEVENLSKIYKLGSLGTGTISHDLNRWWHRMRNKQDISLLSAEKNDRKAKDNNGYVWSLKDVSFEIKKGEIFGIIGGNGAGKSTLLKLLSKITKPTSGSIRIDGRVASLLEVGTGFHPELTGRENIFLNGAILGLRKHEIRKKFDEIVDFSGIDRYIDTPVKKYSSGMYVRLAFAVAAHLEPDILIIDEVLAVGDAEFQAKCLGKMQNVSRAEGRTVLFVSHHISAVKQLCTSAMLLEHGEQKAIGKIDDVVAAYQQEDATREEGRRRHIPAGLPGYFTDWRLEGPETANPHSCYSGDLCVFSFGFRAVENLTNCEVQFLIKQDDMLILNVSSLANNGVNFSIPPGEYRYTFKVRLPLKNAKFDLGVVFLSFSNMIDVWASSTKLTILNNFSSHLTAGIIDPVTQFAIETQRVPRHQEQVG